VATSNVAFTFTAMTQINGAPKATVKESGDVEALNLATGKVEWDAKVKGLPLGAATVSNNLVFTTIFEGSLVAFNRATGALVYTTKLPRTSNSPLAIAGNTVLVALGGPKVGQAKGASQLVAYSVS
jgi:alcohol dehydrogenase (cytochrome c)